MRIIVLLFCIAVFPCLLSAQTHSSVSVEETELYRLLDIAEISGWIDPLPAARPLPRSQVKKAFDQLEQIKGRLTEQQRAVMYDYRDRFADDKDEAFLNDGDLRIKHDLFPLTWRFYARNEASIDAAHSEQNGIHNYLGGTFMGDLGKNLSYGFDLNIQVNKVFIDDNAPYPYAWTPYSYTKVWDNSARYIKSPVAQNFMPKMWALGWTMNPEMTLSFREGNVWFRFGRMRRDWGIGEGNLFLAKQARPFMGLEGTLTPWKWLSFSFIFGNIEYGPTFRNSPYVQGQYPLVDDTANDDTVGPKEVMDVQQNMISLFQIEIKPFKWLSISFYDIAIYLKRLELGYMFPFASRMLTQTNIGDVDNILTGGTITLTWPGLFRVYGNVLMDEYSPVKPFNDIRNQMAYQAGIKAVLPMGLWSLLTFQYTKIEPFTYTHYITDNSPWYDNLQMEIGYQNHGENIGSYLEPNSDEFLLSLHLQPSRIWSAAFTYRLIRHGGPDVPGSSYDSWGSPETGGGPDADPNGAYYAGASKNFLRDGLYEWFHIFSLGTNVDLRSVIVPVRLSLQYSFVYEFDSDYSTNNSFNAVGGSELFRHIFTIGLNVWAK